jgi:hypothetical protein
VLSGVSLEPVSGPLPFNTFNNDLCEVINHSNLLLFADDLKVHRAIKSPSDCLIFQWGTDCRMVFGKFLKTKFSKVKKGRLASVLN